MNLFAHTLVGFTNTRVGGCAFGTPSCHTSGVPNNALHNNRTNLAMGFGGGVELNLSRHFAMRLLQADSIPTRLAGQWENNFRASTGVFFRFAYSQPH